MYQPNSRQLASKEENAILRPNRLPSWSLALTLGILLLALSTHHAYAAGIIYVTADGGGDGSSWTNATELQSALRTATSGDQIWVKQGAYWLGSVSDTFLLPPGVAIYGSFAGGESDPSQRQWLAHTSVLSGDFEKDDDVDVTGVATDASQIRSTNSLHVVTANGASTPIDASTRLDGFVITGGNAQGVVPASFGGGFYCNGSGSGSNCSPHLENIIFSGNAARSGAAMYNAGNSGNSSPTLTNVTFSGNAASDIGGAMVNDGNAGNSSPTLLNVTFSDNSAANRGGAIENFALAGITNPSLDNVMFTGNSAMYGGAIFNFGGLGVSSPSLTNVTFVNNSAGNFAGAIFNESSNPNLTNVNFLSNSAATDGGAIYNSVSSPSLTNSGFVNNSAGNHGGAILNNGSSPTLVNSIFITNSATNGGAIFNDTSYGINNPELINVTMAGNSATNRGGAMYNSGHSATRRYCNPTMTNVILWGNRAGARGAQIYNFDSTVIATASLLQDGINGPGVANDSGGTVVDGGGNLDADPHFRDFEAGDLRLAFGSPAIDQGRNSFVTTSADFEGNDRIKDGDGNGTALADMGAYEAPTYNALVVSNAGAGAGATSFAPAGIPCTSPCSALFQPVESITVRAISAPGSAFSGWSGDCTGIADCVLRMDTPKHVTATYTLQSYPLTVNTSGSGSVTKHPDQLTYLWGTVVTVTAAANRGWSFSAWSGDCSGTTACVLTIDGPKSVTAAFIENPLPTNHPPTFTSAPGLTATVGSTYTYAIVVNDPDHDALTVSAVQKPAWLTFTPTGSGAAALLMGIPTTANIGINPVQLRVQDASGAFSNQSFAITVAAAPTPVPGTAQGGMQGRVVDREGHAIVGVQISISTAGGEGIAITLDPQLTGNDGHYRIEGLAAGNYTLTARIAGLQPVAPLSVTVHAGSTTTVPDIILQPFQGLLHLPLLAR